MESTGIKSQIHLSQETADLIINSGKSAWIKPREDKVHAKGKGKIFCRVDYNNVFAIKSVNLIF